MKTMETDAAKVSLLESDVLAKFFHSSQTFQRPKGQILIYRDDAINHFYFIKSGFIRVYNITDDGEERTLLILTENDLFPLLKDPERPNNASIYFYEAMTDCEYASVQQQEFLDLIKHDQKATWTLFRYISDLSGVLTERVRDLGGKSAEDKVLQLFEYLITVCGEQIRPNVYRLKLKLTQQEIGNLVGHTRETASLTMKKLEERGVVNYKDGLFVITSQPSGT